jgi:hypothetical protein
VGISGWLLLWIAPWSQFTQLGVSANAQQKTPSDQEIQQRLNAMPPEQQVARDYPTEPNYVDPVAAEGILDLEPMSGATGRVWRSERFETMPSQPSAPASHYVAQAQTFGDINGDIPFQVSELNLYESNSY